MMEQTKNRHEVLACLSFLEGEEEAKQLLKYAGTKFQAELKPIFENVERIPQNKRKKHLLQLLKSLQTQSTFSGIAEMHPAWLVKTLQEESPRVVALILRHLPSRHVRYILEHLPKSLVARLPKLVESFYISSEILNLVRKRFERHFVPMPISHQVESFRFGHLYYLKIEELQILFRDLGVSELSLALITFSKKLITLILNRFGVQDAKVILERMKEYRDISLQLRQDAQYTILELHAKDLGVEPFLKEVGFASLAKAFGPGDTFYFEALKQKLSLGDAAVLKRYLEENFNRFNLEVRLQRQEWVLQHLRHLCEEGKIDAVWKESLKKQAA